jgi:hypothetical protein
LSCGNYGADFTGARIKRGTVETAESQLLRDITTHDENAPPFTPYAHEVRVWVPLRRYQLTIRHKLLSQLGRISHFLIICLNRHQLNMAQIEMLTALSEAQLAPIIKRLQGLQILNNLTISKTGRRYAYLVEKLHEKSAELWMDASHGNTPCLISARHSCIEMIPENVLVVGGKAQSIFKWPVRDWSEDCARQQTCLKNWEDHSWLPWLYPAFTQVPDQIDCWWGEWDLELRVVGSQYEGKGEISYGMPITLLLSDAAACMKPALSFSSPVLCLLTQYSVPEGMPDDCLGSIPEVASFYFDYLHQAVLDDIPALSAEAEIMAFSPEAHINHNATIALFQARESRFAEDSSTSMLNRQHLLSRYWRKHEFSWESIKKQLCTVDDDTSFGGGP